MDLAAVAAQIAELPQARAEGAEGRLLRRELVAVVAAAAGCFARLVGPLQGAAVLRDALAALPVAHQAAFGKHDGLHLVHLERSGELGGPAFPGFPAYALPRPLLLPV